MTSKAEYIKNCSKLRDLLDNSIDRMMELRKGLRKVTETSRIVADRMKDGDVINNELIMDLLIALDEAESILELEEDYQKVE